MSEELTWTPAHRIRELIVEGEVSPVEVTEHFLGRIEEHDGTLKAFRHVDHAGAREQAKAAEVAVQRGGGLGALHGVPISVKEHISAAGLPVLVLGVGERKARFDDLGVARLRDAGAVMVGTNTMMGTQAPEPGEYNWDAEARNPWDPTRVPGWSSSGGAAAAAARLLPVTIGSDGGGAAPLPAALSGVVGLHTSRGLIPFVDYEKPAMLLTVSRGPLARNVRDVALFTEAMAGPDGRDYVCLPEDTPDMVEGLSDGIEGMRLAWTEDFGFASRYATERSAAIISCAREAAHQLATLGGELVETDDVWEDRSPESTD